MEMNEREMKSLEIFQNTFFMGSKLKKRGKERRKLVWEKFGMNPGRTKTERLHQNRHNFLYNWNFDARLPPLEILLMGLQFGHKNDLKKSSYEGVMPIRSWACRAKFPVGHKCVQSATKVADRPKK